MSDPQPIDNASVISRFGQRPDLTPLDVAAAIKVAYVDDYQVSGAEEAALKNLIRKLPSSIRPISEALRANPLGYAHYIQDSAARQGLTTHHLGHLLRLVIEDGQALGDDGRIQRVLNENPTLLPQAVALVKKPDKYEWLRAEGSPRVNAWVATQNQKTDEYLGRRIPFRDQLFERVTATSSYPLSAGYQMRGDSIYYFRIHKEERSVIYRKVDDKKEPEVVFDPNKDLPPNTKVTSFIVSQNNNYAIVGLSKGGSDWTELYVMDLKTKKLSKAGEVDSIKWTDADSVVWNGGEGFYYRKYNEPKAGQQISGKKENARIFYHKLGTNQKADKPVQVGINYNAPQTVSDTSDGRFKFFEAWNNVEKRLDMFYTDQTKGESPHLLIKENPRDYEFIDHINGKILVLSTSGVSKGKLVLIDPSNPDPKNWQEIIPEKQEPIKQVSVVDGKIVVTYIKDGRTTALIYDPNTRSTQELTLPGIGTAYGFSSSGKGTIFYTYYSFNQPQTRYELDLKTLKSTIVEAPVIPGYNPNDYEVKQVIFNTADIKTGKPIPVIMFIMHRKGVMLDGTNPVLMEGYGGFNEAFTLDFTAKRLPWLEQGGIYVSVALPGDKIYGKAHYELGKGTNKPNTFRAFVAAAQELIRLRYTSPKRIAIRGGSNGGLLVAVAAEGYRKYFGAAVSRVPVLDMIREAIWEEEYGSTEKLPEFQTMYGYSPFHNLGRGNGSQVPILITTGENDDRVSPYKHAFPYTAKLQDANPKGTILIRVTKGGHRGSISQTQTFRDEADQLAFIMYNLGMVPKIPKRVPPTK